MGRTSSRGDVSRRGVVQEVKVVTSWDPPSGSGFVSGGTDRPVVDAGGGPRRRRGVPSRRSGERGILTRSESPWGGGGR